MASDTSEKASEGSEHGVKLVARVGRERQRYAEDGERLIAGCIPIRSSSDGDVQVLMVSSRRGEGLIFPKGGWETDETAEEAAARESLEEAGVRGELREIGSFEFMSKSSERKCVAHVFVMTVTEGACLDFCAARHPDQWLENGARLWSCFSQKMLWFLTVGLHQMLHPNLQELATWPEQDVRSRSWCAVSDAISQCRHDWMKSALQKWAASLVVGDGVGGGGGGS